MKFMRYGLLAALPCLLAVSMAKADGVSYATESAGDPRDQTTESAGVPKEQKPVSAPIVNAEPKADAMTLERAQGETLAAAVGHYAKARSLLVAAVREFDEGYKTAKPDSVLNSKHWRNDILDRAKDLEKVLAPQPRISNRGVSFNPDNHLLNTEAKSK